MTLAKIPRSDFKISQYWNSADSCDTDKILSYQEGTTPNILVDYLTTCHFVIGHGYNQDSFKEVYVFLHVSTQQMRRKNPPPYHQLLSAYNKKWSKLDFVVIDPSNSFSQKAFQEIFSEYCNTIHIYDYNYLKDVVDPIEAILIIYVPEIKSLYIKPTSCETPLLLKDEYNVEYKQEVSFPMMMTIQENQSNSIPIVPTTTMATTTSQSHEEEPTQEEIFGKINAAQNASEIRGIFANDINKAKKFLQNLLKDNDIVAGICNYFSSLDYTHTIIYKKNINILSILTAFVNDPNDEESEFKNALTQVLKIFKREKLVFSETKIIFSGANLAGVDFYSDSVNPINLAGLNLSNTNLSNANLNDANLAGANLTGSDLVGVNLAGANLTGANLNGTNLSGVDLTNAILDGVTLDGAFIEDCFFTPENFLAAYSLGVRVFKGCMLGCMLNAEKETQQQETLCGKDLRGIQLINNSSTNLSLENANLAGTNLTGIDLVGVNLAGVNLTDANLTDADLTKANLTGANLSNANLNGADLTGANLTGVNLTGVDLAGVTLTGATLDGAFIENCKLTAADFLTAYKKGVRIFKKVEIIKGKNQAESLRATDLRGIQLTDSSILPSALSLERANLARATLTRTNLSGLNLTGAKLTNADLTCVNLTGANLENLNILLLNSEGAFIKGCDLTPEELLTAYKRGVRVFEGIHIVNAKKETQQQETLCGKDLRGIQLINNSSTNLSLENANLAGANLTGIDLAGVNLAGANLIGANLSNADLNGADLTDANLSNANLNGTDLTGANLTSANLTRANLTGVTLTGASLDGAFMKGGELTTANFLTAYEKGIRFFKRVKIIKSKNQEESLRATDLHGIQLIESSLSESGLSLERANLTGANLTGTNLSGLNLTGSNLTDADLTDFNLTDANLANANLTGAKLTGINLSEINLTSANLTDADLTNVNLTGANLAGANLTGTNLSSIYLNGANLAEANLTGANIENCKLNIREFCTAYKQGARTFKNCTFREIDFGLMNLENIDFTGANFEYCEFTKPKFQKVNFKNAKFKRCRFQGIDIGNREQANFAGSEFIKSEFELTKEVKGEKINCKLSLTFSYATDSNTITVKNCTLTDQELLDLYTSGIRNFEKIRIVPDEELEENDSSKAPYPNLRENDLSNIQLINCTFVAKTASDGTKLPRGANFTGANLSNANLTGTNLTNADLTNANLTGAILTNADLTNANLSNANLNDTRLGLAKLTNANLTGAILNNADLTRADLTNADLSGAKLSGANFTGANLDQATFTDPEETKKAKGLTHQQLNEAKSKTPSCAFLIAAQGLFRATPKQKASGETSYEYSLGACFVLLVCKFIGLFLDLTGKQPNLPPAEQVQQDVVAAV